MAEPTAKHPKMNGKPSAQRKESEGKTDARKEKQIFIAEDALDEIKDLQDTHILQRHGPLPTLDEGPAERYVTEYVMKDDKTPMQLFQGMEKTLRKGTSPPTDPQREKGYPEIAMEIMKFPPCDWSCKFTKSAREQPCRFGFSDI
jgi:hypothetical protein